MDDVLRARNHRNENVAEWIDEHQAELDATPAVTGALKDELLLKIQETLDNDAIATQDNTGVAETKNIEREELVKDARECLNFLVKHYTTLADREMLRKIDYNKSELENADNTIMEESANRINEFATPVMAALILIGYTALKKTAFDAKLVDFRNIKGKPKAAKVDSSSKVVEVALNLDEADAILDLLDVEINLIQFSHDELYRAYYIVRKIDDSPTSSGSIFSGDMGIGESKKVTNITYSGAVAVKLQAMATEDIDFFLKDAGVLVGAPVTVTAGGSETKTLADLAPSGNELWARNLSGASTTTYKVTFL